MKANYITYAVTTGIDICLYLIWIIVIYAVIVSEESEQETDTFYPFYDYKGYSTFCLAIYLTIGTALKIAFAWNMVEYYDELYGAGMNLLSKDGLALIILA